MAQHQSTTSHQTVRLEKGKHSSPDEGACAMELASMLAGERFSDQPKSVSPVIAAFLRAYNDRLDDARRQHLYAYAAKVVGTSAGVAVECRRAQRCLDWQRDERARCSRLVRWLAPAPATEVGRADTAAIGSSTVESIRRLDDHTHRRALRLVDELVAMGRDRSILRAPSEPPLELAEPRNTVPDHVV